ncbi:hypothetical protein M3147_14230 [Agromyces mediolanus]|uniref:hypothetical protein n=1 Tax=Agromyces mediolanus TaxID=41986 RepID=UPI00203E8872|nr:hypothetical protein [Agromyces mediolanus]MCM3658410.1 hypothetical protein [Agromyces mediolanus]
MSAVPAQSLPAPLRGAPAAAPTRRLRLVPDAVRRRKPRIAYAIIALGAILLVAAAQLVLSVAMTQGAYELDSLRVQQTKLERDRQIVGEELDALQSPQNLARNAEELGMVPNTSPVYLRLSDGAVLGQPQAAGHAASSGPLVPNSLITDVPLVNQPATGENATGASGAEAPAGADAQIVPPGALPTPDTH